MNTRTTILSRIRDALADRPEVARPEMPKLWPDTTPEADQLVARFGKELVALRGEMIRCPNVAAARAKLREVLREADAERIGAADRPSLRDLTAEMAPESIEWGEPPRSPVELAELSAGLVEAEYLLADTGSCAVVGDTPHNRLMCYLPPLCVVLARTDRLRQHMPAMWADVVRRTEDPDLRGEMVLITGPSRTADIEKILILGVHGPKRVVVLLVDSD